MSAIPFRMRAAVYRGPRDLRVEDHPVPSLGAEDVLVEVGHCGVCGTDLHLVMDGWGRPDSIGGHEYSGRIAAIGRDVRGWSVGDGVVGGVQPGCGACEYCAAGRPGLCVQRATPGVDEFQGAFAEFVRVHQGRILRIPDGLTPREAALCEPLAVALHAITRSRVRPEQRVLVTGLGPIGALILAALRARGVQRITVTEPSPARRALAARLGASRVVPPDALVVPPMPFTLVDDPVEVVFECSGRGAAVEAGLGQLRRAGRLVLVGTGMERPRLDANRVILNELVVTGAYEYDENGCADALSLLASHRLPTDVLIEPADVALDQLLPAMEGLVAGGIAGKVMVAPQRCAEVA